MQQEKRRRVLRTGSSVKDGEPIDLYVAIKGWVLHGPLLSLGLRSQVKWSERHRNQKCHAEYLQESEPTGRAEFISALKVLRCGPDDDLVDFHVGWLLDGVGDCSRDRAGRDGHFHELAQILSGCLVRAALRELRGNSTR